MRSAQRPTCPGLAAEAGGEEEKDGEQHGSGSEQNRVHPAAAAPPTLPLVRPVPFPCRKAPRARAAPRGACGGAARRARCARAGAARAARGRGLGSSLRRALREGAEKGIKDGIKAGVEGEIKNYEAKSVVSGVPAGLAARHGFCGLLVTRPSSTHGGRAQAGEILEVPRNGET